MARTSRISDSLLTTDDFINRFNDTLRNIDESLPFLIDFKTQIQKTNLMIMVKEADKKIQKYESIYPYIKELCKDQTINPGWYKGIEKVLNWALKKGRGNNKVLGKDIKSAWITYIVLLSCSMIDKEKTKTSERNIIQFRSGRKGYYQIMGSN